MTYGGGNLRRIVLIDDDPTFCSLMQHFAQSRGLGLDTFTSLQDMGSIGRLRDYSVAIVDFDLGCMNGLEIAEYLPVFFGNMPMLLVSGMTRRERPGRDWPQSIKKFMHKDQGPDAILDAALALISSPRVASAQL